jgi:hypothetical protein
VHGVSDTAIIDESDLQFEKHISYNTSIDEGIILNFNPININNDLSMLDMTT